MARWTEFEQLAAKILAELQPDAKVEWNDHIRGHLTETDRQIDVSIRWSDQGSDYLTIVQAKDTGTPADIGVVDEFVSVIRDVQANRGILVCRSGFSSAAHTYARNCGISLINLHDAQSINWSRQLTIPIIWTELTPNISLDVVAHFEAGDTIPTGDPLGMALTYDTPDTRIDPMSTFKRYWNGPTADRRPGMEHALGADRPMKAIVQAADQTVVTRDVLTFAIRYTVDQKAWLGQFRPTDCRGIVDYLDGAAFVASYLPVSEIPFQRDIRWEPVDDPAKVAVSLRGTVVTTQRIVVIDTLASTTASVEYLGS